MTLAVCAGVALGGPSLAAAASTWLPEQQLSDGAQATAAPVVAADARGTVLSAWTEYDGTHYLAYARVRPPGGSFGPVQTLSEAGATAQGLSAAFDPQGDAIAVWSRNGIIQYSLAPAGGSFGPSQDISAGGEDGNQARVAFDSQGNAVVTWVGNSVSGSSQTINLHDAVRPAGGSFGPQATLDSFVNNNAPSTMVGYFTSPMAADAHGNLFAVWTFFSMASMFPTSTSYALKTAIFPAGGAVQGPVTLASTGPSNTPDLLENAGVAADPAGDVLVVWNHSNTSGSTIEGSFRSPGGLFTNLSGPISSSGSSPAVALDANGNAIVVFTASGSMQQVQGPAAGPFSSPHTLTSSSPSNPAVAFSSAGDAVVIWGQGNTVEGAVQPAGGTFGSPAPISSSGTNPFSQMLAPDGQGDVIAGWGPFESSNRVAVIGVYDASNPVLQSLSIPATGTAGSPLSFSVDPLSIWLSIDSTSWTFGDGSAAAGASVSHTYGAAGAYPVGVTATDSIGNTVSLGGSTQIAAAAVSGGGGSTGAGSTGAGSGGGGQGGPGGSAGATGGGGAAAVAAVSAVGETNSVFAVGPTSTPLTGQAAATHHAKGTVFSFQLDRPATMRIAIQSLARGRRVGRTCRADSRRLRRKPRCTRVVTIATLTRGAHAGLNRVPFTGRIGGRALRPGHYQAVFTAVNPAGSSPRRTLAFTIVRR